MAVISLRLNQNEEKMVNFLSDYYEQDRSSLIKYSLKELYEDIIDRQIINEYEAKEKNGEINFIGSNEIMNIIKMSERDIENGRVRKADDVFKDLREKITEDI
jgi:predicted transcriptional regulator